MIGIGLKTTLWNRYKELATKNGGGYNTSIYNVRGGSKCPAVPQTHTQINVDMILSDLYYMAYTSIGGRRDKLNNERLFHLNGVSQVMWTYFMCMRAIGLSYGQHKKDKKTPPYILNDLQRIITSKGCVCKIQDLGGGKAQIGITLNGNGGFSCVEYTKMSAVIRCVVESFSTIIQHNVQGYVSPNELNFVLTQMREVGKAVIDELY